MKRTCNQCHKEIDYSVIVDRKGEPAQILVCSNPACPNYALLQISMEMMPKEDKKLKGKKHD